jgi:hypothetical protein
VPAFFLPLPSSVRHHWQAGRRYLWLAAFMGGAILLSLKTGEHYPFSHFPMYGNPNPKPVDYYFLTDAAGNPLPVANLTGDTAPKLKKRLNTELNEWGFANNTRVKSQIPADVRDRITKEILDATVAQSKHRGTPLPDRVQLWRGEIHVGEDGYHETFVKEAEN